MIARADFCLERQQPQRSPAVVRVVYARGPAVERARGVRYTRQRMQVGLLTPPGVLRDFVARAIAPAGHELVTAPDAGALLNLIGDAPEVVLFAPAVAGTRGVLALGQAQKVGLKPTRSIYLGLDGRDCSEALQVG